MVDGTVLVIGAGSIGKRHAGNLAALGAKVELIGWRAFDEAAIRARTDVAAVVIATATPIRLALIQLCADKDWPFYAEKPLAWQPEQVEAIFAAAAPVAKRSVLGFMMRYHPVVLALRNRDLSDLYGFFFEIGHDVRQWRPNWRFADSYAASGEGGGVLLDLCHELDMALALMPDLHVTAVDSLGHADFPGVDFATRVTLAAPNGPVGTVSMDYLSPLSLRRAGLRGLGQTIDIDLLKPEIISQSGSEVLTFERNDMFLGLMRDFLALAGGAAPSGNPLLPRFDRMRASCDLIAAAWQARQFRGTVTLDMG